MLGLDFVPLVSERYDLAIRRQHLDYPPVAALLDTLNRAGSIRLRLALAVPLACGLMMIALQVREMHDARLASVSLIWKRVVHEPRGEDRKPDQ